MSFYDEADAPRRASGARRASGGGSRRPPAGGQQLGRRRLAALGAGLVVLIILFLGIKSCASNQAKQGLKDYNQGVSALVQDSDSKVSKPLFEQLTGATGRNQSPADAQNSINDIRVVADQQLGRAADLSTPDELKEAQREFLLALTLRRDGVAAIAQQLQPALGASGGPAITRIAAEMRRFDASDVLYSTRVAPLIAKALAKKDIKVGEGSELIARTKFLPDVSWLDPSFVSDQLGSSAGGTGRPRGKPAPGTHGHALTSVAVGSTTLDSGTTARIPSSPAPVFAVKIQNGGENDEKNVRINLSVTGGTGKSIDTSKTLPKSPAGQESTVSIPLPAPPPTGQPVKVKITVVPVLGETKNDNNSQTYPVTFTAG